MNKWEQLDTADIPRGGGELRLLKRADEFAIRITGTQGDLMNSRTHGSEDALGELACAPCAGDDSPAVLIGGLGMGFTLAAALATLPQQARVTVAELVPAVVQWNRGQLGACAGYPLNDQRAEVVIVDVGELINKNPGTYDAIILDVDNGPEGLTHPENDDLYALEGLKASRRALRPGGLLAVWSVSAAPRFTSVLKQAGFKVEEKRVRAHMSGKKGKGARHTIWLATRD